MPAARKQVHLCVHSMVSERGAGIGMHHRTDRQMAAGGKANNAELAGLDPRFVLFGSQHLHGPAKISERHLLWFRRRTVIGYAVLQDGSRDAPFHEGLSDLGTLMIDGHKERSKRVLA